MGNSRKRRKKESYLWSTVMVICAVATIMVAVMVIFTVVNKIKKDTAGWESNATETTASEIVIETEAVYGWVETDGGTKYREEDGTFAKDVWKVWNENLYYLNENELMEKGRSVSMDGQIYTFADTGILQDIQLDPTYAGDGQAEQESLVRSSEFYCYLDTDSDYEGEFYPIVYRKAVSDKEEYLGGENIPEVSSKNSLQIVDGWIYYLPQTTGSSAALSTTEQGICNSLFRMRPGDSSKELLASAVTGYLVVDETVYYASEGKIQKAGSGTQYPVGEEQFQIRIQDGSCYLLDGMGSLVSGDSSGMKVIGDRMYKLDNGKISYVKAAPRTADGMTYKLKNENGVNVLAWEDASGDTGVLARAEYGINSFCIAENWIYYSAYVKRGENGERFSQIYRISLDGSEKQTASKVFAGNILNLYYYEGQKTIYGEYSPASWESAYGQIVTVGLDGTVKRVDDSAVRDSSSGENKVLELLLAGNGTLTCYENFCRWDAGTQTWEILSSTPIQFSDADREVVAESALLSGDDDPGDLGGAQGTDVSEMETQPDTSVSYESPEETGTAATAAPESRPSEVISAEPLPSQGNVSGQAPSETNPRPGETIGSDAPGTETRPSETIGNSTGSSTSSPVIIIPAL